MAKFHETSGIGECDPAHFKRLSRRGFLSVGAFGGAASLTLADLFRVQQAQAELKHYEAIKATAKSVIHIFMPGGMAHQESFDPKPFAPIEYRGEMGQVQTKIDGALFGETLAKTGQVADNCA